MPVCNGNVVLDRSFGISSLFHIPPLLYVTPNLRLRDRWENSTICTFRVNTYVCVLSCQCQRLVFLKSFIFFNTFTFYNQLLAFYASARIFYQIIIPFIFKPQLSHTLKGQFSGNTYHTHMQYAVIYLIHILFFV